MKTIDVVVTPTHVKEGEKLSCRRCPIALALKEAEGFGKEFPNCDYFGIAYGQVVITEVPDQIWIACLGQEQNDFIEAFDAGKIADHPGMKFTLEFNERK